MKIVVSMTLLISHECFTELHFLSWLLVVSFAILIAVPVVFSRTWTSYAVVLKMPRVSNAFKFTHNKKRNSITVHSNTCQLAVQIWRLSKVRTGWPYAWVILKSFRNFPPKAHYYPAYCTGADWSDWTVPTFLEFSSWKRSVMWSIL